MAKKRMRITVGDRVTIEQNLQEIANIMIKKEVGSCVNGAITFADKKIKFKIEVDVNTLPENPYK